MGKLDKLRAKRGPDANTEEPEDAAEDTELPVESVGKLNDIFAVMDDLEGILQEVLEGWQPLRVVVIGNQSEGASLKSRGGACLHGCRAFAGHGH